MPTYEPRDKYYRKARERGLPSRAAFKIEELIARAKIDVRDARIADLGCAPGGWLAILARAAGPSARIVGVDLAACPNLPARVRFVRGDILDPAIAASVIRELGGPADLVTSDLSPKLSGIAARDEARTRELLDAARAFAIRALSPGGAMVAKVFMSGDFKSTLSDFELAFEQVETTRTGATRPGSAELYLVARRLRNASARRA